MSIARILIILSIPLVLFYVGGMVMSVLSDRESVTKQLSQRASPADRKPLYQRLGYDTAAVQRHWSALDAEGLKAHRVFLEMDLVFPFLYGAGLLVSLLLAWVALGRPFSPAWLTLPVGLAVLADWTENLTQWKQVSRYMNGGAGALQAGWIQIASAATTIKILFCSVSYLFVFAMVAVLIGRWMRQA